MTMDVKTAEKIVLQAQTAAEEVKAANGTWMDWQNRVFGLGSQFLLVFTTKAEISEWLASPYAAQIKVIGDELQVGKTLAEWTLVTMPIPYIVLKNFKIGTA